MEVIAVLGPLGSGKTTAVNGLIEQVPFNESYAVVVNDVGTQNIDARRIAEHPANRSEKIIALTAGCIGCSDVTQFRDALKKVHDSDVGILFIEPTGIAPGNEIVDVIQDEGYNLSVLTLVNVGNIERDLKWQVLPSQLAVADIIGLTHAEKHESELEIVERALDRLPPVGADVALRLMAPERVNGELLATLRGVGREYRLGKLMTHQHCELGCDHGHDHHDHAHNHGVVAQSLPLLPSVTIEDVKPALMGLVSNEAAPLLRAKGTISGWRFDVVGDDWSQVEDDSAEVTQVNVIFGGDRLPDTGVLRSLIDTSLDMRVEGDKKSIVKSINESLSVLDRIEIARERVNQYPAPVSVLHGEIIPDCEADEGYELCFWGANDMPEDVKRLAMDAYIDFRLSGLHQLLDHPEGIANVDQKRAYWMRRYGATLGYNSYYLGEYVTNLDKVKAVNPASLLAVGFMELDSLTFDEGRAEEKPEFLLSVFRRAIEEQDLTKAQVETVFERGIQLSSANIEFNARWVAALENIRS